MFVFYIFLCVSLYAITNHLISKLGNLPPSPFPILPIIGHFHLLKKPIHRALAGVSDRHGPVLLLRFGSRPVLLVSSPSAAEECLAKHDTLFANRPRLLAGKHLGYNHTSLAWAPYGDSWRNLRRIATTEMLSSHRLQMMSHVRADEVRALIRRLARRSDPTVEIKPLLFELMMNNMMRMIAGKRFYGGESEEETRKFEEIVSDTLRLGGTTNVSDFVPLARWVWGRGYKKSLIALHKKRDLLMQGLIEENRKPSNPSERKNMIEVLLSLQESDPEYYTDDIIRGLTRV